jgi:hypothetical protein
MLSLVFAAAAAAAFTSPMLRESDAVTRAFVSMRTRRSGAAFVDLVIKPDGRVMKCDTLALYGAEIVSTKICGAILQMQWRPGTDASGNPTFWRLRTIIKMFWADEPDGALIGKIHSRPDLELTLRTLPAGMKDRQEFWLGVAIDGAGKATDCAPQGGKSFDATIVSAACRVLRGNDYDILSEPGVAPISFVYGAKAQIGLANSSPASK